jgi:hypothetical protein
MWRNGERSYERDVEKSTNIGAPSRWYLALIYLQMLDRFAVLFLMSFVAELDGCI